MSPDEPETPPQDTPTEASESAPAAAAAKDGEKAAKPRARKKAAKADAESAAEEKPVSEKTTAAKKPAAKKAAGGDGEPQAAGRSATKKRAAKKAASAEAAAPGDAEEAQELAKAEKTEKPATKVARRAVAGVKETPRRRVVSAHARYVRTSARKARMVCPHIRGKSVQEARAILAFTPREVARDWSKLLESAVANAESNHELLEDDLIVREAYADEGPTIKRFRPRAMGRATPIRKRTSHLTITLIPRPEPGNTKRHG
jgi:ribosomal protein L22